MLVGFEPMIAYQPKVLILGSMPSVTSLEKQEYYGFKQNRFWRILQTIFDEKLDTYEQKKEIILKHHIILWDVIKTCEREGSLDSAIKNVVVNDIETLISKHASIYKVICNGKKSYELYQKYFSHIPLQCIYLPSTSNANRSIKEDELYMRWFQELKDLR